MSSQPRLYLKEGLAAGQAVHLDDEASKYLLRVMRLSEGDEARVFNGRDSEWLAELGPPEGKQAVLLPRRQLRPQTMPEAPHLSLLFAPVKKAETDFIVEKATELGVRTIRPILTRFTQTRTVRLDRFNKIALEAAEQTERLDLPDISDLVALDQALADLPEGAAVVFCDESGDEDGKPWGGEAGRADAVATVLAGLKNRSAAILIGPEGGFSPEERSFLRNRPETYPVSLGPRILRAETAAVSALTLWQAICGDWT